MTDTIFYKVNCAEAEKRVLQHGNFPMARKRMKKRALKKAVKAAKYSWQKIAFQIGRTLYSTPADFRIYGGIK